MLNLSTRNIVFTALMGALMFVLSFVFGSALNVALGNPAASGFASTLIQAIIMTVAVLTVRRFGIITGMWYLRQFLIPSS